jgi:hypothetical protein
VKIRHLGSGSVLRDCITGDLVTLATDRTLAVLPTGRVVLASAMYDVVTFVMPANVITEQR